MGWSLPANRSIFLRIPPASVFRDRAQRSPVRHSERSILRYEFGRRPFRPVPIAGDRAADAVQAGAGRVERRGWRQQRPADFL